MDLGNNLISAEAKDTIRDLLSHVADVKLDDQGMAMLLVDLLPCIFPASDGNIDPFSRRVGILRQFISTFLAHCNSPAVWPIHLRGE